MDPLAPLIASLHAEGRLRVWSLVITAFGDLVQHRGGAISTARLGAVLGRIGVEPGALRTALSRLTRDGWVERRRAGRFSIYRLSAKGSEQFAPATTRIYAPPRLTPVARWSLALRLSGSGQISADLTPLGEGQGDADCRITGDLECISETWRAALLGDAHRAALGVLAADIGALAPSPADPLNAAAARLLLIHRWRRIVLRHGELAPELMPADAPLSHPRAAVARAYGTLSQSAETWLDVELPGIGRMPEADQSFAKRFVSDRQG